MRFNKRFFLIFLFVCISVSACEKREPTYVLRQMHGSSTFNHHAFDSEAEDKVRFKYMPKDEARRERRVMKQREAEYARRKRVYFPKK